MKTATASQRGRAFPRSLTAWILLEIAACGGSSDDKAATCPSGYQATADGGCAKATPCPAGTHDNGAGICVPTVQCPAGYHDGGSGTCVPVGTCSSGYHDGGDGECLVEGHCSSGFHDGGKGACVPLVACSASYHDGGDGACVPDGRCSPGYHDGGDGRCVALDRCSPGYHDGGDGGCRHAGTCAAGFVIDGTGVCLREEAGAGGSGGTGGRAGATGSGGWPAGGAGGAGGLGSGGSTTGGAGGRGPDGGLDASGGADSPDVPSWPDTGAGGQNTGGSGRGGAGGQNTGGSGRGGAGGQNTGGSGGAGGGTSGACGNGKLDPGELCDCGDDVESLPEGCPRSNGLYDGSGMGCSRTCTKEPSCVDPVSGKTQACTTACGDGNVDSGEACDDGNLLDGDGCSSACAMEQGFACSIQVLGDTQTCRGGSTDCLRLAVVYRDFQPENVAAGGHPDFHFLGSRWNGSTSPTTICVPNSSGPAKGNDSTARCWGTVADTLLHGKPQLGSTKTCACQLSDWSIANSSRIPGGYTQAGNDSPLSDGQGSFLGGSAGAAVDATNASGTSSGVLTGYTPSSPGGPIWKGTVPAIKDAASLAQWFTDDDTVNKRFTDVLELTALGTNVYQYATAAHLMEGGFFPLDTLNPSQATLCNLWPYWNHGTGAPIWSSCAGDQYLHPPLVRASDCPSGDNVEDGCWVSHVTGRKHDYYFTAEMRTLFVYDGATGLALQALADNELFVFINGQLVLDLGGIQHGLLPGKVVVNDATKGDAQIIEGGCLDSSNNITGVTTGSKDCSPLNATPPSASSPDDFRQRTVRLGLTSGKTYELAIFHANRAPAESNLQLTLTGSAARRSVCARR